MNPTHDVPQRFRHRRLPARTEARFAQGRNSGVTFPIHNDEEHDGEKVAVRPMPACAGRSACLCYPPSEMPPPGDGLVEVNGIEPMTSCLQSRRSPD